jgi:hypothetical protein
MIDHSYFELKRLSDDLVYQFDLDANENTPASYIRRDRKDLRIIYKEQYGWVAYCEETDEITGRIWNILPEHQSKDYPPESIWVSKKGAKSYVYELRYNQNAK